MQFLTRHNGSKKCLHDFGLDGSSDCLEYTTISEDPICGIFRCLRLRDILNMVIRPHNLVEEILRSDETSFRNWIEAGKYDGRVISSCWHRLVSSPRGNNSRWFPTDVVKRVRVVRIPHNVLNIARQRLFKICTSILKKSFSPLLD